jgi:hypothetical protein
VKLPMRVVCGVKKFFDASLLKVLTYEYIPTDLFELVVLSCNATHQIIKIVLAGSINGVPSWALLE